MIFLHTSCAPLHLPDLHLSLASIIMDTLPHPLTLSNTRIAPLSVFWRFHLLFIVPFLREPLIDVSPPAVASLLVSVHLIRLTLNLPATLLQDVNDGHQESGR